MLTNNQFLLKFLAVVLIAKFYILLFTDYNMLYRTGGLGV